MFCCPTKSPEKIVNNQLTKYLKEEQKRLDAEIKLLLLGAGDSGKSTLAKQMKILHLKGFTDDERRGYIPTIMSNIVISMKTLVTEASKNAGAVVGDKDAVERILKLPDIAKTLTLAKEQARDIKSLWADPAIIQTYNNASIFHLMDNIKYYFDDMDRISADGFIPNDEDILKSRATTTGIHETVFDIQDAHFKMVDVGGQRTERRKWIHCFEGVTAVLFCASLNEYDQLLIEDDETMRMHESLKLFGEVCQSPFFSETAMILFLNKVDLFREKIARIPLSICFAEYVGPNTYEAASDSLMPQDIHKKFINMADQHAGPGRAIYHHFTCATNTQNINVVFDAVRDIVLRIQLSKNGMI